MKLNGPPTNLRRLNQGILQNQLQSNKYRTICHNEVKKVKGLEMAVESVFLARTFYQMNQFLCQMIMAPSFLHCGQKSPYRQLNRKVLPVRLTIIAQHFEINKKSKTVVQITVQWLRKIKENMLKEPLGKLGKDFMLIATAALKNPTLQNQFQHLFLNRSRQFKKCSGITFALLEIRLKLSPFNQDIACTTNETKLW